MAPINVLILLWFNTADDLRGATDTLPGSEQLVAVLLMSTLAQHSETAYFESGANSPRQFTHHGGVPSSDVYRPVEDIKRDYGSVVSI